MNEITEEWLKSVGFKWHQIERQQYRHWVLWLDHDMEVGLELEMGAWNGERNQHDEWFCWMRSDTSGRYHRFVHVRHIRWQHEVEQLVAALSGLPWNPKNHIYGCVRSDEDAERLRRERDRLDLRLLKLDHPWHEAETDEDRGRALPEHMHAAMDGRKVK